MAVSRGPGAPQGHGNSAMGLGEILVHLLVQAWPYRVRDLTTPGACKMFARRASRYSCAGQQSWTTCRRQTLCQDSFGQTTCCAAGSWHRESMIHHLFPVLKGPATAAGCSVSDVTCPARPPNGTASGACSGTAGGRCTSGVRYGLSESAVPGLGFRRKLGMARKEFMLY